MTPELATAIANVQGELADLIESLDGPGARYARAYTTSIFEGRGTPGTPRGLSSGAARLIRDIALDQSAVSKGRSRARSLKP